jgi:hypothetical protein
MKQHLSEGEPDLLWSRKILMAVGLPHDVNCETSPDETPRTLRLISSLPQVKPLVWKSLTLLPLSRALRFGLLVKLTNLLVKHITDRTY